ncbi:MAG: hypothetical protein JSU91_03095 [Thermoplasmatales archaeon]|nr:MAG: hypothetical protein JSU91_03095 [Thermoplasmatales archaeon]
MRRIIIGVLISMLVLSSCMGAFSTATSQIKSMESNPSNIDFSHAVFAEYFTMTTCVPCKYAHQALYQLYYEGWYNPYFYYITYVYNKNNHSNARKNELQVVGSPTTAFDGGYRELIGASDIEVEKTRFNNTIAVCAARDVYDIDLSLNVEWLGAVNNHPEDGETLVPIEAIFNWTVTEMKIDVTATNNDASDYNGHIHIQVTECNSSFWDDKFGYPYTFEFKDYALNQDMELNSGDTYSETIYWDGMDHDDAGGDDWNPHIFDYITQENIMVIASVFDKDNDKYTDETVGFLAGVDTDPKFYDVYFGDTNPPPKVISNGSAMKYDPPGDLNWSTTYYWKIDIWNDKGELQEGEVWDFTTRGNAAPNIPIDSYPKNSTTEIPIDTNLTWLGGDPDGDDVTYDIYFGEFDPFSPPPQVEQNWTGTTYDPTPFGQTLDFETKYEWKIVAWDEYGLNSSGEVWNFLTEINKPPYPASAPRPPDGTKNVPVNASLFWNGSDPNSGDRLTYDVYFGPNPDPPLVSPDQSATTYDPYGPNDMPLHEDFYWRIVTRDREGLETDGPDWTFTTGVNPPPTDPEIDGPTQGGTDIVYEFTFVSTDPDDNQISYYVDWGDGTTPEWTSFYNNATVITLNHTWLEIDDIIIKAKAKDEYGEESGVSEWEITIPRNRAVSSNPNILSWLFESFPRLFQLLRNLLGL